MLRLRLKIVEHLCGFLTLAFSLVAVVHSLSPLDARSMTAQINISGEVEFHPSISTSTPNFRVSSTQAKLRWFPRQSHHQHVKEMKIEHDPCASATECQMVNDGDPHIQLDWKWDNSEYLTRSAQFSMEAIVETTNEIIPVYDKIQFPLSLPLSMSRGATSLTREEMVTYLQAGKIANHHHPHMQQAAWELVEGKDDLYHAVFAIADWVYTNIEYSLASIDIEVHNTNTNTNQKQSTSIPRIKTATQVFQSRCGKCDEITALFISFNRAVGIPCRFVSGFSYTDDEELIHNIHGGSRWGPHSWAEVYFSDDVGWVPFDVTYGQFGYVDAGHVLLSTSDDAEPLSVTVEYSAFGEGDAFRLVSHEVTTIIIPGESEYEARARSSLPFIRQRGEAIDIRLEAQAEEVGFGSAAVVVATLRNNRDHYISTQLHLVKPKDIDLISTVPDGNGKTTTNILLKPREEMEVPFFFNMNEEYTPGFHYDYTFSLSSTLVAREALTHIRVKEDAPHFYARGIPVLLLG